MKLVGNLLIWASLALGVVAVVSAYTPSLWLPDDVLLPRGASGDPAYLELNGPAGVKLDNEGRPVLDAKGDRQPLGNTGDLLTPDLLRQLRENHRHLRDAGDPGVRFVRVKQFAWRRWPGRWAFIAACVGLSLGAFVVRRDARARLAAAAARRDPSQGPEAALATMRHEIAAIIAAWPTLPITERLKLTLDRISRLQREQVPAFESGRDVITARVGLSGFARVMDAFAAGERQMNRAWSAAADEVAAEVIVSLQRALPPLQEAAKRLQSDQPAAVQPAE
jgi:hypothetical protein